MMRRIGLVLAAFITLFAAYLIYVYASGGTQSPAWQYEGRVKKVTGPPTTVPLDRNTEVYATAQQHPKVFEYDSSHTLRAKYEAQDWTREGEYFRIVAPHVEWYLKGGETVVLTALRGMAKPRETGSEWGFRSGRLEDNVRVLLDRNTDPRKTPMAERPDDVVEIQLDYVEFDQDRLMIRSDSPVVMKAKEADTFGTGLWVSWSEGPRVLRELRIERGDRMIIREGQDKFIRQLSLPVGSRGVQSAAVVEPAPAEAKPAQPATLAAKKARSASKPAASASRPASRPGRESTPQVYLAEFTGSVNIENGKRYMHGTDILQLTFESKSFQGRDKDRSASQPSSQSASAVAATPPPGEPVIITWTGPLVLKPVLGAEPTSERQVVVAGRGKIEMADEQATATCLSFTLYSPEQRGELVGSADAPAKLAVATGELFVAQSMHFERQADQNLVRLEGKGSMHLPGKSSPTSAASEASGTLTPGGADQKMDITWSQGVLAAFSQRQTTNRQGSRREDYLRYAHFTGDVDATVSGTQNLKAQHLQVAFNEPRPPEPGKPAEPVNQLTELHAQGDVALHDNSTGDFIQSQILDVEMAGLDSRGVPRRAFAKGDVVARQENRDLSGQELTVTFVPEKDPKTGKLRPRAERLDGKGNVRIEDRSGSQPMIAEADTLTSNLIDQTAVLVGKPARVTQNDKHIEGEKVLVDGLKETANVPGAGLLSMYTDMDLGGVKLPQARYVEITWRDGLRYDGKQRMAVIRGEVEMLGEGDHMTCDTASVLFAVGDSATTRKAAAKPAATRPAAGATTRKARRGPEYDFSSPQRIAMFHAESKTNVVLERERNDPDGYLVQSMLLTSPDVVYQAEARKLTCDHPGFLMVADYREPEVKAKKASAPRDSLTGEDVVTRPSQSAFQWSKTMSMQQDPQGAVTVLLVGNVQMRQASGSELQLKEGLNTRLSDKLPQGEHMLMNCDELLAMFAAPEPAASAPTSRPATLDEGVRVGPLDTLDAQGKVTFEDKARQAHVAAERILYRKARDVAMILGHLPGQPLRPAQVSYYDRERGGIQDVIAPEIYWYPQSGKVEVKNAQMHGVGGN